jgi:hypothetical protein
MFNNIKLISKKNQVEMALVWPGLTGSTSSRK